MSDETDDGTWPDFDHGLGTVRDQPDDDPLGGEMAIDGETLEVLEEVVPDVLAGEMTLDEALEAVDDHLGGTLADGAEVIAPDPGDTGAGDGAISDTVPVYEVETGDNLWNIAETYLGDGTRWPEIADLNADLIEDPDLIYPGWELRLPDDASGEGLTTIPNPDAGPTAGEGVATDSADSSAGQGVPVDDPHHDHDEAVSGDPVGAPGTEGDDSFGSGAGQPGVVPEGDLAVATEGGDRGEAAAPSEEVTDDAADAGDGMILIEPDPVQPDLAEPDPAPGDTGGSVEGEFAVTTDADSGADGGLLGGF